MTPRCLVLNAGSSSLKFGLYEEDGTCQLRGVIGDLPSAPVFRARAAGVDWPQQALPGETGHESAVAWLLDRLHERGIRFDAVGHRVVHGGMRYAEPARVDAAVLAELEALASLAPLHQGHNLAGIREIAARHPDLPQIACFDTAFHRGNADLVQRYALPDALHRAGIRRYGFHGLSYQHLAAVLPTLDARAAAGRTIALHLGHGASLCALRGGASVASSMGFSALDGVPMATRCGQIDPGVILHLLRGGMDADAVEDLLYQRSGLLGVSGFSGDMRVLLASADAAARTAVDLFVLRIVREVGALAAMLGGLDALVFTGGIGEHAAPVRAAIVDTLGWLGARLDADANARHATRIAARDSAIGAYIVPADEEGVIAQAALRLACGRAL
ncbi:MAG: acetate/propionate family kinase [Xanthomonadales bacterium]|nr:Acetate kinase [Xanthomonadales bacterium]MCC6594860.1 acetate/propionate family kinase [Xanthomonadales bacterium]MCE7930105.1 acetate/propionate family kinase [Xanthomonadales bacterium PRO6]